AYRCCIALAPRALDRRADFRRPIGRITCFFCDMRPQCFRGQGFQRQSLDRGCKPTIVLVDGDVGGDDFRGAVSRLATHAMRPNLAGSDSSAPETLDADW